MKCDLHLHTTASDGRLTPAEIVELAVTKKVEIIAITDHDTVSGIREAVNAGANFPQIRIIPGVEINTDLAKGELHILGYFLDYESQPFIAKLENIQKARVGRAHCMVDKLAKLGLPVSWERVQELAHGESICRPHVAQAMLERGYVATESEAFDKYIGRNGPAYAERDKVKPEDAVRIIIAAGGVPVLAHPAEIEEIDALIVRLKDAGLKGLEAYYGQYDAEKVQRMVRLAGKYDLFTTGGTDYHHFRDEREVMLGSVDLPRDSVRRLYQAAGKEAP